MIDYRKVGNFDDLVISHSDILNLEIHPTVFKSKMQGFINSEDSPSLERGDLLHLWLSNENKFVIAELDKPSGKPGEMLDYFYKLIFLEDYKTNTDFHAFCAESYSIDMAVLQEYKNFHLGLYGKLPTEDELRLTIAAMRYSRIQTEFGGIPGKKGAYAEGTIQEKIKEVKGIDYLRFINNSKGKIVLTKTTKNILTNCKASLDKHPLASALLEAEGFCEHEMFWTSTVDGIEIKRKGKLDKAIVNYDKKIVTIIDWKTMSGPVTQFKVPNSSYYKYKYPRQIFSYERAFCNLMIPEFNTLTWRTQRFFGVVQTTDTYPTMVYKESLNDVECQKSLDKGMQRVAYHIKSKNWDITMEEQQNGGFASEYNI